MCSRDQIDFVLFQENKSDSTHQVTTLISHRFR